MAMTDLGNGLTEVQLHEDALTVREAELSMRRRTGASEEDMLAIRNNLANSYAIVGRRNEALRLRRDVYHGQLKLKNYVETLRAANNYALSLIDLKHPEEVKPLLRQTMPIARRLLEENDETRLRMGWYYGIALYLDAGATLDELREAVTTLEDVERIARRVFGGAHPVTTGIEKDLRAARAALRACESPPSASGGASS